MPPGSGGALVRAVAGGLDAVWLPLDHEPLPPGLIALTWTIHGGEVRVSARMGFPTGDELLGTWPHLGLDWTDIVAPTVREAQGLAEALAATRAMLEAVLDSCS